MLSCKLPGAGLLYAHYFLGPFTVQPAPHPKKQYMDWAILQPIYDVVRDILGAKGYYTCLVLANE